MGKSAWQLSLLHAVGDVSRSRTARALGCHSDALHHKSDPKELPAKGGATEAGQEEIGRGCDVWEALVGRSIVGSCVQDRGGTCGARSDGYCPEQYLTRTDRRLCGDSADGRHSRILEGEFAEYYSHSSVQSVTSAQRDTQKRLCDAQAVNFYAFDVFSKTLLGLTHREESGEWERFTAGALAGVTALLTCLPLDTIRTRLLSSRSRHQYNGMIHAFTQIVRTEGFPALYKG